MSLSLSVFHLNHQWSQIPTLSYPSDTNYPCLKDRLYYLFKTSIYHYYNMLLHLHVWNVIHVEWCYFFRKFYIWFFFWRNIRESSLLNGSRVVRRILPSVPTPRYGPCTGRNMWMLTTINNSQMGETVEDVIREMYMSKIRIFFSFPFFLSSDVPKLHVT